MVATLKPMRERADALKRDPRGVMKTLRVGADKARELAHRTITEVRERMGFLKSD
jgi:tryptophanyl-tRNA synthetase